MEQHTTPCAACPFLRASAPGWLGASTPEEFIEQGESDIRMPCHLHVNYERDDWERQVNHVPQCVGRAAYLRNRCKMPRDRDLAAFVRTIAQDSSVFSQPQEFLRHHHSLKATTP